MYQDIQPHVYNNSYVPKTPSDSDIVFIYDGSSILMKNDETFFHVSDFPAETQMQYLFTIDDPAFFMTDTKPAQYSALSYHRMRTYEPKHLAFAAITGWQLYNWRQENKFCGRCGTPMVHDKKERAVRCPMCGHIVYPKIMPAVIVGVTNDKGQILLTKYAAGTYHKFALVAGFTEIGETVEETVRREVKEETGLDVTDLKYYKSQPWSFSSTILMGFWAKADSKQPIITDHNELKSAAWYDRDVDVSNLDYASLTAEMIRLYKKGND